jgi:hypothetical protein
MVFTRSPVTISRMVRVEFVDADTGRELVRAELTPVALPATIDVGTTVYIGDAHT